MAPEGYSKEVARCLLLATALTAGVKEVTPDMEVAWSEKAFASGMGIDDFKSAIGKVCDKSKFFPAWGEVLAAYRKAHDSEVGVIRDPVLSGEQPEDMAPVIGSRELCAASGTPYQELSTERRALPATVGKSLESSLKSLESKMLGRGKPRKRRRAHVLTDAELASRDGMVERLEAEA